jgi:hypothetical protein
VFCPPALPFVAAAMVAINGGDFGDMLRAATLAAVNEVGWGMTGGALDSLNASVLTRVAVHGCVGGALNEVQGGSFQDGFISAAAGEAIGNSFKPLGWDGTSQADIMGRSVTCGVVGGTVAEVTGGNFSDGFTSAAFGQMFNSEHALYANSNGNSPIQQVNNKFVNWTTGMGASVAQTLFNNYGTGSSQCAVPVLPGFVVEGQVTYSKDGYQYSAAFGVGEKIGCSNSFGLAFADESTGWSVEGSFATVFGSGGTSISASTSPTSFISAPTVTAQVGVMEGGSLDAKYTFEKQPW